MEIDRYLQTYSILLGPCEFRFQKKLNSNQLTSRNTPKSLYLRPLGEFLNSVLTKIFLNKLCTLYPTVAIIFQVHVMGSVLIYKKRNLDSIILKLINLHFQTSNGLC